jgi:hypothetical protein
VTESILKILSSALGIWQSKEATRYQRKLLEFQEEYSQALRATPLDNGVIDEARDKIKRLSNLVAIEMSAGVKK